METNITEQVNENSAIENWDKPRVEILSVNEETLGTGGVGGDAFSQLISS